MKRPKLLAVIACAVLLAGCNQTKQEPAQKAEAPPKYFQVDPASTAQLSGTVRAQGKKPAVKRISMEAEAACQEMHPKPVADAAISVNQDGSLANVFVYVKSGLEGKAFQPPTEAVVLDQRGCLFVPRVIALRAGQTLTVKNSDPVSHSIHPMPENNRDWKQQQSPGAPDLQRRFARPEVMIPVKCNIHAWMKSYMAVLDHPYFAVTGKSGEFTWAALPPGKYTIAAWHEALGERTQEVTLKTGVNEKLAFTYQ